MNKQIAWIDRMPGWLAKGTLVLLTWLWTYWGVGEAYHEGWWGAWYNPLVYLIAPAIFLVLAYISLRWPLVGGGIVAAFGVFATFFFGNLPIGLSIVMVGAFMLLEGRRLRKLDEKPDRKAARRWFMVVWIPALLIAIAFSAALLPQVLSRVDDGDRTAQMIEGNGVTLEWAPEGPGWNWKQPWGGYPSWDAIALYGVEPVGMDWSEKPGYGWQEDGSLIHAGMEEMTQYNVCRYLAEDGMTLKDEPQDIWRMPTVEEYVHSLVHHGANAGCVYEGESMAQVQCDSQPDKESPLWSTDVPVIYYWASEEFDDTDGYYVSHNGWVNATRKSGGNPRHSYRCVRELGE